MEVKKIQAKRTELICVLDKSGSMHRLRSDTIGGYNAYIKDQLDEEGYTGVSLILFDTGYEKIYENIDINTVPELDETVYVPGGMTSLNDAIGITLTESLKRHTEMDEDKCPDNVVVAILTDGHENTSKEYTTPRIKELISFFEKEHDWKFIYLATNQDAFDVGRTMGFDKNNSVTYSNSDIGTRSAFQNVSMYSKQARCVDTDSLKASFCQESEVNLDEKFKAVKKDC